MYKRYWLGTPSNETNTVGSVFKFFVFCALVVNLLPAGIEAVSGLPLELFMVPPVWRAEMVCSSPDEDTDRDYKYTLDGSTCTKVCTDPGTCSGDGTTKTLSGEQIETNMRANAAESRRDLGIHGIFDLVMLGFRYGTVLAAMASLGVLRLGRARRAYGPFVAIGASMACAPLVVLWAGPVTVLPVALGALAAAYAGDAWSTSRFGRKNISRREVNPLMRWLVGRYGVRLSLVLHPAIYGGLVAGASVLMGLGGPLSWDQAAGMLALALAGAHAVATVNNIRAYRHERVSECP